MEIVIHCGAHCTDDESLLRCIVRNKSSLDQAGVLAPARRLYRDALRETLNSLGGPANARVQRKNLLEDIAAQSSFEVKRLILSNPNLLGLPNHLIKEGFYYPGAVNRMTQILSLFAEDEVSLFMAVRNPASHLPEVFQYVDGLSFNNFLHGSNPVELEWHELFLRLRDNFPNLRIYAWSYEDLPFIWGELVRLMTGVDLTAPFKGEFDILAELMNDEGMRRFEAYFMQHTAMNYAQQRRVMAAFLSKYLNEDLNELSFEVPGWGRDMIETITELYRGDIEDLRQMDTIRFIAP